MTQDDEDGVLGHAPPLDEMLAEALDLVDATRRYLESGPAAPAVVPRELPHVRELDRITTRLGHVVVWLLTCKAGGPAMAAAGPPLPRDIVGDPACLEQPLVPGLPARLQDLLDASADLYARAVRLATERSGNLRHLH
jgi:hypothetical protein